MIYQTNISSNIVKLKHRQTTLICYVIEKKWRYYFLMVFSQVRKITNYNIITFSISIDTSHYLINNTMSEKKKHIMQIYVLYWHKMFHPKQTWQPWTPININFEIDLSERMAYFFTISGL